MVYFLQRNGATSLEQFQQIVNSLFLQLMILTNLFQDRVRFCRYYLVRYALSFLEPTLKSHTDIKNKDCIFHFKQYKHEIKLSLASGHICDNCRNKLQPRLTNDINDAITKLLLVVSNQHPYSIILKGGGVKGLAFAGALLVLEEHFSFNAFAGTSAGAIASVLLGAVISHLNFLKN